MPELQPVFGDHGLRCRRYVGVRPHSRDGHCGLAAKVILNGEPLCYVHTPVAFRQPATGRFTEQRRGRWFERLLG